MVSSGIIVSQEIVSACNAMKMDHDKRYIVFKIEGEHSLLIEHIGDKTKTYQDFVALLPEAEPRFAVVDYEYMAEDREAKLEKILFFH